MQATEVDDIYDLKLRQLIEDEIFSELESLDTKVLDQKKKIAAQGEQIAAQGEQLAAAVRAFASRGLLSAEIAGIMNLSQESVEEMLRH